MLAKAHVSRGEIIVDHGLRKRVDNLPKLIQFIDETFYKPRPSEGKKKLEPLASTTGKGTTTQQIKAFIG